METYIHTVKDGLNIQSIAICQKFNSVKDFLAVATGRNLKFYQFKQDQAELVYSYKLFDDVSLLIPYLSFSSSLLLVVFTSMKFSLLELRNGIILSIDDGELTSSIGVEIGTTFSYSIFESLIAIQFYQTCLHLFMIQNKKVIFIQNFIFFSPAILRFQIISSNAIAVLLQKLDKTEFQIHKFDLLSYQIETNLEFNYKLTNFLTLHKRDILITGENHFVNLSGYKIELQTPNPIQKDIFDIIELNDNKYKFLMVAVTGDIFVVNHTYHQKKVGKVQKPLKLIHIDKKRILIPSKYGETFLFAAEHRNVQLKPLFWFSGPIVKFLKNNDRSFYGLTKTSYICKIERTISFNEICCFQSPSKVKSWFVTQNLFLFSSNGETKLFPFRPTDNPKLFQSNEENSQIPIQTDEETLNFKLIDGTNFLQIVNNAIYYNSSKFDFEFDNITSSSFSDNSFAVCDHSNDLHIFDLECQPIFRNEFEFQINAFDLFSNQLFAISSWTTSSIIVFKNNKENNQFEQYHEFKNVESIKLLFIDSTHLLSLSPQSKIQVFSLSDFTFYEKKLGHNCFDLFKISNGGIIISGNISFIYKNGVITEIPKVKPLTFCDSSGDLLLMSHNDQAVSLCSQKNIYETSFSHTQYMIYDAIKYDVEQYAVIFKGEQHCTSIALTSNLFNLQEDQIDSEIIHQESQFKKLILIEDQIFKQKFIVAAFDQILYSIIFNSNDEKFIVKASLELETKPIGLTYIQEQTFCVLYHDICEVYSLTDSEITKLSHFDTLGASKCFSSMNSKLLIGDMIESFVIYEISQNNFTEKFRETNSIGASSCTFVNDNTLYVIDINSYLYKLKTKVNENNYSSGQIAIEKSCSIGSNGKSMIYDENNDAILISTTSGEIIEVKDIDSTHFDKRLYEQIENKTVSIGNLSPHKFRKIKCMGYFLGIPRIYDSDILTMFKQMTNLNKQKILHQIDPNLTIDLADNMCDLILDQL